MSKAKTETKMDSFQSWAHRWGRVGTLIALIYMVALPFVVLAAYDSIPSLGEVFNVNTFSILLIYIPVGFSEALSYTPILGCSAYLAFITGNLINMKIPCAVNARDLAGVRTGTPENEIVSTLSIATSSLVTIVILALGVLALVPLQPVLQSPALQPAFANVVPALFGAMAYQYYRKNIVVAIAPLVVMSVLFTLVPGLISSTSFMIIPSGALAIGIAYTIYKKKKQEAQA
mgnify:CR=1 FL=1